MSQSPVKPMSAEERAELRLMAEQGHAVSAWRVLALLDALDEAEATIAKKNEWIAKLGKEVGILVDVMNAKAAELKERS